MRAQILLDPNLLRKERRGREKESAQKRALTLLSPFSRARSNFFRESERAIPFTTTTTKIRPKLPSENKKEESRRFLLQRARARVFARASSEMRSLLFYHAHLFPFESLRLGEKERRHKTRLVSVLLYLVVVLVAEDNGCGRAEECEE